jgi:hypothetical protein
MAHGDYNCCAICDSKMEYSNYAETKNNICSNCVCNLAEKGKIIRSVDD